MTDPNELPLPRVGDPRRLFRVRIVLHSQAHKELAPREIPPELLTFRLTYPRSILAEVNTHRILSKSSESSRAMPAALRRKQLTDNPYFPLRWGQKQAGMGSGIDMERDEAVRASLAWEGALLSCLEAADRLATAGAAKEELNRVTEPWALVRTVLSGSQWANFFALRTNETAHPALRFMARAMFLAVLRSTPQVLRKGEWHLPFITPDDRQEAERYIDRQGAALARNYPHKDGPGLGFSWTTYTLCRWSASRCARVSYGLPDRTRAHPEADDRTWAKLAGIPEEGAGTCHTEEISPLARGTTWPFRPVHASPMEHQGTPGDPRYVTDLKRAGNLPGWIQFRKLLGGETVHQFQPPPEVIREWESEIPEEVFGDDELY